MNMPVKTSPLLAPSPLDLKVIVPRDVLPVAPEIRTMSRSMFDHHRIGATFKGTATQRAPQGRQAAERPSRSGVGSRRPVSEKSAFVGDDSGLFDDDQETLPYRVAARSTLDSMLQDDSEKNREQITEALARIHEPLQQFTVLFGAMKEIDSRSGIDDRKKQSLKNAFSEMMTSLVHRDPGAIRRGLRDGADTSPVTASLDAARTARGLSTGLRDLRFKIGARARGGVDEELSALVITRSLLKTVGAAHTEEAMESVCSRLMPGLRTRSAIKEAAYSLTISDAVTFSIARSGFKAAWELKRNLAANTGMLCKLHHVEAATLLFMAAEQGWGKGKGNQLTGQLVDLAAASALVRAKVYTVIRAAIASLPAATWPQEKKSAQGDLLEDLDRQVLNAYADIPLLTTQAERKEEEWRNLYAAGRAPTPVDNE